MTKSTRDIPTHEGMTIADRLKVARTDADFTRKALAEATGIPASTIEKYERGEMDPNTTRLQTICEHLDVSVNWVLNGEDTQEASETENPVTGNQSSANVAEPSTEAPSEALSSGSQNFSETAEPANDNDVLEPIRNILAELDSMRANEFDMVQRGATALIDEVLIGLKYCEPHELLALALERNLFQNDCATVESILDMFRMNAEKAQSYCGSIEERLIDSAIFGVDLYCIERKALVDVADNLSLEHEINSAKMFGWGGHADFVPLIRPYLRTLAVFCNSYDFEDTDEFPRREKTDEKESKRSWEAIIFD